MLDECEEMSAADPPSGSVVCPIIEERGKRVVLDEGMIMVAGLAFVVGLVEKANGKADSLNTTCLEI